MILLICKASTAGAVVWPAMISPQQEAINDALTIAIMGRKRTQNYTVRAKY